MHGALFYVEHMQIAARIGASLGDVTLGTGVASAVGALQELGLASLTGELRVGVSGYVQQLCRRRDSLFAYESVSATGDLRCSWE